MKMITSRKNPLIVHLKRLGSDADYRHSCGEFLCDGEKLLREAVQFGAEIKAVLTSGERPSFLPDTIDVSSVPQDIIDTVSPLKNPPDILFSCGIPDSVNKMMPGGFYMILEGIQDPGNVGTILRTAGAFNVAAVILTGGCADPYNPKTVRATMGGIFRQSIFNLTLDEIRALKENGLKIYGAALSAESIDVRSVSFNNAAAAIGSEGRGLSQELLNICDEKLIIPMSPDSESLNAAVAAAIIMWEAARGQ